MVAPLVVISLFWERFDWRSTRLFRPRQISWHVGRFRRTISGATFASAVLLAIMGVATFVIGVSSNSMPSGRGWQESLSSTVQHWGSKLTRALSFIPGWVAALLLVVVVALLVRHALRQLTRSDPSIAEEAATFAALHGRSAADHNAVSTETDADDVAPVGNHDDYATQEV
jgi:hypothetical protein